MRVHEINTTLSGKAIFDGRRLFESGERAIDHILGHEAMIVHRSWDDMEPIYAHVLATGEVIFLDAHEA